MMGPTRHRPPCSSRLTGRWALYDWGSSAFPAVVSTFVIAPYITQSIALDPVAGQVQWGWMQAVVGLGVALLAPALGAVADAAGRRSTMLICFTLLSVLATAAIWRAEPDPAWLMYALVCVGLATLSFELASTFYNAALPDVAGLERLGRVSALAWGLGYFGGLASLGLSLVLLVQPQHAFFALDHDAAEHFRATAVLVAAWMLVFTLPAMVTLPEASSRLAWRGAASRGLTRLRDVLRTLPGQPGLVRLLVARLFYSDGLNTLSVFCGIYAAGVFAMGLEQILIFGIAMNASAGAGCLAVALIEDRLGSRRVVVLALAGIVALGVPLLSTDNVAWFWSLALAVAFLFGAPQSASRTLVVHVSSPADRAASFGLFALTGRLTGFVGPTAVAAITAATESQRLGVGAALVLIALGALILACGAQGRCAFTVR